MKTVEMDCCYRREYNRNMSVDSDTDWSGDECSEKSQEILYIAKKEKRIVTGIYESAHLLEMCPDLVEVCILPVMSNSSITADIQHKLIRAFCWENGIQVVEMFSTDLLTVLGSQRGKGPEVTDTSCVLVTSKQVNWDELEEEIEKEELG